MAAVRFSELVFPDAGIVLELHAAALAAHGGSGGLRDQGLLESAVVAPQQSFGGELAHPSLARMAAALAYAIVKNHAFVDGNKRAGLAAALAFLDANGHSLDLESQAKLWIRNIRMVAGGGMTREDLAGEFAVAMGGDVLVTPE